MSETTLELSAGLRLRRPGHPRTFLTTLTLDVRFAACLAPKQSFCFRPNLPHSEGYAGMMASGTKRTSEMELRIPRAREWLHEVTKRDPHLAVAAIKNALQDVGRKQRK